MDYLKDFVLIELAENDWEKFRDIRLESLVSDPYAFGSSFDKEKEYTEEKWRSRLKPYSLDSKQWYSFLQNKDAKIIGMIGAYVPEDDIPIIIGVYVNKNFRDKGLGTILLNDIINKIRRKTIYISCMLSVNTDQIPAVKLYKKAGFKVIGEGFGMLGDG